jgi:hypothetical protein|eukprot:COSAG06_NODE_3128_length_5808_cov_13.934314_3_plen_33_part_00
MCFRAEAEDWFEFSVPEMFNKETEAEVTKRSF